MVHYGSPNYFELQNEFSTYVMHSGIYMAFQNVFVLCTLLFDMGINFNSTVGMNFRQKFEQLSALATSRMIV